MNTSLQSYYSFMLNHPEDLTCFIDCIHLRRKDISPFEFECIFRRFKILPVRAYALKSVYSTSFKVGSLSAKSFGSMPDAILSVGR